MSHIRTVFVTILPSMIAGGFLFASESGHAEAGRDGALGFWPEASDTATGSVTVAQADPRPRARQRIPMPPPMPPMGPVPPAPPVPPVPPSGHGRGHGHGVSISIHDDKVEIEGIEEMVQEQLENVLRGLENLPDVPPDVRDRLKGRVKSVRDKVKVRLGKLRSVDLDKIGPEVERMGDEIEKEMEGLDKDLARLGDKIGKHFAEKFGKDFAKGFGPSHIAGADNSDGDDGDDGDDDDDDKDVVVLPPNVDTDMVDPDMRAKIADLANLLNARQRADLAKLRADSDHQVASAKRELDEMSERLHDALDDAKASEADIAQQIDQISQKEATIRKARILTWVRARKLLDNDQRKRVEAAAKKNH